MSTTPSNISEKRQELERLRDLSAREGWKDLLLPKLERLRDVHAAAGLAKNSTPAARAEHVEAYHLAVDLVAFVPDRIAALTKELAAHDRKDGAAETAADVLTDRT